MGTTEAQGSGSAGEDWISQLLNTEPGSLPLDGMWDPELLPGNGEFCFDANPTSSGDSTHQDHSLYLDGLDSGNLGDLLLNSSIPGEGLEFMNFPDPPSSSSLQENAGASMAHPAAPQMGFVEQLRQHSDDESAGVSGTKGVSSSGRGFPASPQQDAFTSGLSGIPLSGPALGPTRCSPGTSSCSQQSHAEAKSDSEKGTSGATGAGDAADEDKKREARMLRNRESAHLSRQRKKMQLEEVEQRCQNLQAQNTQLTGLVSRLTAENSALRHQLGVICQQTGRPAPMPLPPMPGPPPGMPYYYHPHMAIIGPTPKMPIQKLKPSRPVQQKAPAQAKPAIAVAASSGQPQHAAVPAATTVSVPAQPARPQESRGRKRARQAAGASTLVLAMLSVIVFSGPGWFPGTGGGLGGGGYAALPGPAVRGGSRILMSLPEETRVSVSAGFNTSGDAASAVMYAPSAAVVGGGGGRSSLGGSTANGSVAAAVGIIQAAIDAGPWVAAARGVRPRGNESIATVVLRPNMEAEGRALQKLKDLAPVALFSDWDRDEQRQMPEMWRDFPSLATTVLGGDGFVSPVMCKEVFQFEASSVADPAKAKQQLKRYLSSVYGFRGRTGGGGSGAVPLLPVGASEDPDLLEGQEKDGGPKARIGCAKDEGGVIVSILLPTKQMLGGADTLSSLSQIYVVVLKPSEKYSTYACALPKPVLV